MPSTALWWNGGVTRPDSSVSIPPVVRRHAGSSEIEPVWLNELGGLTFRAGQVFVKWCPLDVQIDLAVEADKLRWVSAYTRVPEVVDAGSDSDAQWLVTVALPGTNAVDDAWTANPTVAARSIGIGLRAFHDAVPRATCPYDWSIESRVESAEKLGSNPSVGTAPPIDPVVCHGDACAPNTLLDNDGNWFAHVDLGSLGVADRWADLAPAIMSTEWNYGRRFTSEVLDGYGIELDRRKLDFYCRLWDET